MMYGNPYYPPTGGFYPVQPQNGAMPDNLAAYKAPYQMPPQPAMMQPQPQPAPQMPQADAPATSPLTWAPLDVFSSLPGTMPLTMRMHPSPNRSASVRGQELI